jgi:CHASE2 domain-containing sensor protein
MAALEIAVFLAGSMAAVGVSSLTKSAPKGHPLQRRLGIGYIILAAGFSIGGWPIMPFATSWIPPWVATLASLIIAAVGVWILLKTQRGIRELHQQNQSKQKTSD